MACRVGCGACCIALSISSPIPGLPAGKPAGMRCPQLSDDNRCLIYGRPERPAVCAAFDYDPATCGSDNADALRLLTDLEQLTGQ